MRCGCMHPGASGPRAPSRIKMVLAPTLIPSATSDGKEAAPDPRLTGDDNETVAVRAPPDESLHGPLRPLKLRRIIEIAAVEDQRPVSVEHDHPFGCARRRLV